MNKTSTNKSKNKVGAIRRFFWWSAGVVPSVLEKCPTNHAKYTALGVIMVLIAALASVSFAFFLSQSFHIPFVFAWLGSLLWGGLIYSLDRVILTSFRKGETSFFAVAQRFILTVSLSLIISEPLLLKFFEKEIIREMKQTNQTVSAVARQNATARFQTEVDSLEISSKEIENRLDALKTERDEKEKAVIGEIEGISGSGNKGFGIAADRKKKAFEEADAKYQEYKKDSAQLLSENKARLAEIRREIETETKTISTADNEADGVLAKHAALFQIVSRDAGAALVWLPMFCGLLFLETLPLSIKVFGKKSVYDIALESEETAQVADFEDEKQFVSNEKKRRRDLEKSFGEKIEDAILNDEIEDLQDDFEKRVALKLKAEILRKIENRLSESQDSAKSNIKFGREIEIEVVGNDKLNFKLALPENVRGEITLQDLEGDIRAIADETGAKEFESAKAFSSNGKMISEDSPLLPQLEPDQKLILRFEPITII